MNFNEIKLGIAPINWCNDDMPELGRHISTDQCLNEMKQSKFSGTEMGHRFSDDPIKLKSCLSSYQLELASAWHSTYFADSSQHSEQLEILKRKLIFLKRMHADCINLAECTRSIHGNFHCKLSHKPNLSDTEWIALISGLKKAAQMCREHQIKPAYHHHMGTVIQNEDEIRYLMDETGDEGPGLCLDTGHLRFAGTDSFSLLESYYHRIFHIHFKDLRQEVFDRIQYQESFLNSVLQGVFTVPGDGVIDFEPIMEFLIKKHYQGWIIVEAEQDPEKANPLEYAQMSSSYLEKIFTTLLKKDIE